MANLIRIKNLIQERDLNNIIIPVDKQIYLDNAKQIGISGLTDFIMSGFTGSTMIYRHAGLTTVTVGGILVDTSITGWTIQQLFDQMLYSGVPPTTTTTTTPAGTTTSTSTSSSTTTSTSTSTSTSTTSTSTTSTSTTTTTLPPTTFQVFNYSTDVIITNVKIGGISIAGATFPVNPAGTTLGITYASGMLLLEVVYTCTSSDQNINLSTGNCYITSPPSGTYSISVNVISNDFINIFAWPPSSPC